MPILCYSVGVLAEKAFSCKGKFEGASKSPLQRHGDQGDIFTKV